MVPDRLPDGLTDEMLLTASLQPPNARPPRKSMSQSYRNWPSSIGELTLGLSTPNPLCPTAYTLHCAKRKQAAHIVSEKETGKEVNRMLKVRTASVQPCVGWHVCG